MHYYFNKTLLLPLNFNFRSHILSLIFINREGLKKRLPYIKICFGSHSIKIIFESTQLCLHVGLDSTITKKVLVPMRTFLLLKTTTIRLFVLGKTLLYHVNNYNLEFFKKYLYYFKSK